MHLCWHWCCLSTHSSKSTHIQTDTTQQEQFEMSASNNYYIPKLHILNWLEWQSGNRFFFKNTRVSVWQKRKVQVALKWMRRVVAERWSFPLLLWIKLQSETSLICLACNEQTIAQMFSDLLLFRDRKQRCVRGTQQARVSALPLFPRCGPASQESTISPKPDVSLYACPFYVNALPCFYFLTYLYI